MIEWVLGMLYADEYNKRIAQERENKKIQEEIERQKRELLQIKEEADKLKRENSQFNNNTVKYAQKAHNESYSSLWDMLKTQIQKEKTTMVTSSNTATPQNCAHITTITYKGKTYCI